jgi:hypothetical protein
MKNHEATEVVIIPEDGERRRIAEGSVLAAQFVRRVALGKRVKGRKYDIGGEYVKAINERVAGGLDWGGRMREENLGLDEFYTVSWHEVPTRFYLYSKWLEQQMESVTSHPDDVIVSLEAASAAHYGLTQPELHPFAFGNGRTARALVNGILMSCADELRIHKVAIMPVPILRSYDGDQDDRYIRSLRAVRETRSLNPLMTFIAKKWSDNLGEIVAQIERELGKSRSPSDKSVTDILKRRKSNLDSFLGDTSENGEKGYDVYPVPDYFDSIWLKDGGQN